MDNIADFSKAAAYLNDKIKNLYQGINGYIAELPHDKMVVLSLFLLLIILVMALILVWYAKTIINTVLETRRKEREIMQNTDPRLDRQILGLNDEEYIPFVPDDIEKIQKPEAPQNIKDNSSRPIDFDWEKKTRFTGGEKIRSAEAFQYRLKPQKLEGLLGLIVDLLKRGVDEPKIAQTIMFKNQHLNSEDDIIQTITAIKFFIYLCLNGRFKNINSDKMLPQPSTAIFHIARGDCSLALVLLEALIDHNIAKIKRLSEGKEKERRYSETSNCATIFGTFASFADVNLAVGAFELAIELNPRNVTAWGRIGDMYNRIDDFKQAFWAYSNVLNLADETLYTQQIANAGKMLAAYYRERGEREKAARFNEKSREFYDKIGINQYLTEREVKIVRIIESKEYEDMENIIDELMGQTQTSTTGYV
ncbi:MAG: tetratricopeptide repeat protein [Alphaproteobacteria bacterium]|nr:tetratricopeptide repeat protein [Alphaproteobacteria bacterium]